MHELMPPFSTTYLLVGNTCMTILLVAMLTPRLLWSTFFTVLLTSEMRQHYFMVKLFQMWASDWFWRCRLAPGVPRIRIKIQKFSSRNHRQSFISCHVQLAQSKSLYKESFLCHKSLFTISSTAFTMCILSSNIM